MVKRIQTHSLSKLAFLNQGIITSMELVDREQAFETVLFQPTVFFIPTLSQLHWWSVTLIHSRILRWTWCNPGNKNQSVRVYLTCGAEVFLLKKHKSTCAKLGTRAYFHMVNSMLVSVFAKISLFCFCHIRAENQ